MKQEDEVTKLDNALDSLKENMKGASKGRSNIAKGGISALNVATDLLAGVAVGAFTGYYLDMYFATTPFMLVICLILGCAAAFRLIWKEMVR